MAKLTITHPTPSIVLELTETEAEVLTFILGKTSGAVRDERTGERDVAYCLYVMLSDEFPDNREKFRYSHKHDFHVVERR